MDIGYSVLGFAQKAETEMRDFVAGYAITNINQALITSDKQSACVSLGYALAMADVLGTIGARRFIVSAIQTLDDCDYSTNSKQYIEYLKEADRVFRFYKDNAGSGCARAEITNAMEDSARTTWNNLYCGFISEENHVSI